MAITRPVYCTREDVKNALDLKETARSSRLIDDSVMAAATDIYGMLHRRFYPEDNTKYFDWPNYQYAYPWRIWFDQYDLVSATSVTTGGQTIDLGDIFFEPVDKETDEPYTYMELNRSTNAAFGVGPTPQHDVAITGTWGYSASTTPAGILATAISSTTATQITVSDSSLIGTGQIIAVDSERMLVTDRTMADTGQALQADLTAQMSDQSVSVSTGSEYAVDEIILLDAERMLITDITGDNLIVKRAWDGSVLATHSGSEIYAPRLLTVTRGDLGTTAATHSDSSAISKFTFPGLVTELAIAISLNYVLQKESGYSRTIGEGDNLRNASGAALADLVSRAKARYGRKARTAVI